MRITDISIQLKNPDRVNVSVDGKYRFSLDIYQVSELGIKRGQEYSEDDITLFETESQFGKLYGRALEYCLMRPHSAREVRDYLWKKTRPSRIRLKEGGFMEKPGVPKELTERVFDRLQDKGYIDDERFTRFWVENRNQRKGVSQRKLVQELRGKGVEQSVIDDVMTNSSRSDETELRKVIEKKASRYSDRQKFMQYLVRQGFSYDDVKTALEETSDT
jgi:regulatory protein